MLKVLVLGANGLLGSAISKGLAEKDGLETIGTARDFSKDVGFEYTPRSLKKILREIKPDVVVNCVAITASKEHFWRQFVINSCLPMQLAIHSCTSRFKAFHFSSNAVFSGKKYHNHEYSFPSPKTIYGFTKLLGDLSCFRNIVIRTSFIGIPDNLESTKGLIGKLSQMPKNSSFVITDNFVWNGVTTVAIAEILSYLIKDNDVPSGIYHLKSADKITREELVRNILKYLGRLDITISLKDENKPRNLTLDNSKKRSNERWWTGTKYKSEPSLSVLFEDLFHQR